VNIPLSPASQISLYLLQFAVVAAGLGSLTLHLPRMLPLPRPGRFLFGLTLTPFAIGAVTAILGTAAAGAPPWLFFWLPAALAVVPLVFYGWRTLRRLERDTRRKWRTTPAPRLASGIIILALGLFVGVVAPKLWANAWSPISGHDALLYSSKAAKFAEQRTISAIYGLRGDPAGTAREDSHGVLYPAFLGHAMLTKMNGQQAGPPDDYAVRFAFQASFPLMLLAVVALGASYRLMGVGALAVILLLMVGRFEYVSFQSSRDAYRIIPILLYSALLVELSPARLRARAHPSVVLPLLLLPVAALYGHTLSGIVAAISTVVWAGCVVVRRAPLRTVMLLLAIIGVGFVLGSLRYLDLYLLDGVIQGYASVEGTVNGTVLAPILQASRREVGQVGLLARLNLPFAIDGFRLSVAGIAAAFASLAWWWRVRNVKQAFVFLLLGLTVLAVFLPLTGLLDYSGYRISRSFVRNERYTLHWYPYASVAVAGLLLVWHRVLVRVFKRTHNPYKVRAANAALAAVTVTAAVAALLVINNEWRMRSTTMSASAGEVTAPVRLMLDELPSSQKWLLDDDRYNYNLGNDGLVMYTRATWPVVRAQDTVAARQALDDLHIGAVALLRRDIQGWWDELPFVSLLNEPGEAVTLIGDAYLVFDRVTSQPDYGREVAAYLAAAGEQGPATIFNATQELPRELGAARGTVAVLQLAPGVSLVLPDAQYTLNALSAVLEEDPGNSSIHFAMGHIHSLLGSPAAAYQQYNLALENGGEVQLIQRYMAAARSQEAEQLAAMWQYPAAAEALRAAVALAPTEPLVGSRLLSAYRAWGSYFGDGLKAAIIEQYEQDVHTSEADAGVYIALAKMYVELGQGEAALATYRQALERWPDDSQILKALGASSVTIQAWDTAVDAYKRLVHQNPADPDAYRGLAEVYQSQRQTDLVVALFQEAAQANPEKAWPHLELGRLYQQQVTR
jgi:tetratricopeptide (TPR) repeat protein